MAEQLWDWNVLDHSSAATLLAGQFPGSDLEPFGSGDFCIAFKREDQVIRVAKHVEAARALERESCTLPKIAPMLPLPVPQPTYHAPHGCPPFTLHPEIVGEALTREDWEGMPVSARQKAASDLASFLKTLHGLPIEIGLECGLVQIDAAKIAGHLREETAKTFDGSLEPEVQRRLDQTLERWSSQREDQHPALLHCDIGPGHLLYDPSTLHLTGVIDFADLVIGDPSRDFIYIYEDFGPLILQEILTRYAGQDAPKMMPAIRNWYLLEAISWTIGMHVEQREADVAHGLAEIRRELAAVAV
jgi:aminoglycoside phosphotransferase (APT) family kinase protein